MFTRSIQWFLCSVLVAGPLLGQYGAANAQAPAAGAPAVTATPADEQVLVAVEQLLGQMQARIQAGDEKQALALIHQARELLTTVLADPQQQELRAWVFLAAIGMATETPVDIVAAKEAFDRLKLGSPELKPLTDTLDRMADKQLLQKYAEDRQALLLLLPVAQAGDQEAQYKVGVSYGAGRGIPLNYAAAVKWCRKSADQNNANAQFMLGLAYLKGQGVARDEVESLEWNRLAAEQGLDKAQFFVGLAYFNGRGVPADEQKAVEWYRKSAAQNYPMAIGAIGYSYAQGRGVEKNLKLAFDNYLKAAELGDPMAQNVTGLNYLQGEQVQKDEVKAVQWFRKSAMQGHPGGQANLGAMYGNGTGVERDMQEAVKWFTLAAQQGDAHSQAILQKLQQNQQ